MGFDLEPGAHYPELVFTRSMFSCRVITSEESTSCESAMEGDSLNYKICKQICDENCKYVNMYGQL